MGQLGDQRTRELAALGLRESKPRGRALPGEPPGLAGQRGPGGEGFDAAVAGAVALAVRPVEVNDHVAELATGADRAPVGLAAQDESASDSGADRHDDGLAEPARRTGPVLGQSGGIAVVVDEHGKTETLGHQIGEGNVEQRQVDGHHRDPRALVDQAGNAKADRLHLGPSRLTDLLDGITTTSSKLRWSRPETVRCARWWTPSSGSTAPARSFVPPRSTPMVRRSGMRSLYAVNRATTMANKPRNPASSQDPPYRVYRGGEGDRGASSGSSSRGGAGGRGGASAGGPPPPYKVYRSNPRGLRARLRGEDDVVAPPVAAVTAATDRSRPVGAGAGSGGPITPWRVVQWVLAADRGLAPALRGPVLHQRLRSERQPPQPRPRTPSARAEHALLDRHRARAGDRSAPQGHPRAGANTNDKGSRSDTIMLWRIGGGTSRRLSIPRDTMANIPGYGVTKINAAYAYGGPALAIKTIEQFTGTEDQPPDRGQPGQLPQVHRRHRRCRRDDRPDLLEHQRWRQERRLHAQPPPGDPSSRRPGRSDPGPDARERL